MFDFIKSRFVNKCQPLTARLIFRNAGPEKTPQASEKKGSMEKYAEAAKKVEEQKQKELEEIQKTKAAEKKDTPDQKESDNKKNVFERPEYITDDIIKHDYSEDIQKYLDKKNTDTELNKKLPSNWFQVDSEAGKRSEGEVQKRVNEIYKEIFEDKNGPLQEQADAYNAKYRKETDAKGNLINQVTVEELVFGTKVSSIFSERNPGINPENHTNAKTELENVEKALRLKAIRDRLENLSKLREKQKEKLTAGNLIKNLGEGVTNITESFQENLSEGKWVEAGIQVVGMYLVLKSAWTLIKGKPDDKDWVSYLSTNVLKAAVGVAILMPDATRGKNNLLDMMKLTSAADQMDDRGLAELMKGLDWRDRTHAEALNALAKTDIGEIHLAYQKARAEGKSEIDPRQLLGKDAPKKSILNDKELFNIVEKSFERYGAKYFEAVMGRPPVTPQEIQDGITLCVRSHKLTENHSKSFASVVADEEQGFEDWKYPERVEGKIAIAKDIAINSLSMVLHPTKIPEHAKEMFYKWLDAFEIDHVWFDKNIGGPVKDEILAIYAAGKEEIAKKLINTINDFASTQYEIYKLMGAKAYISAVTEMGVEATIELGGATITGIYEAGKGMLDVTLEVGGQIYDHAKIYVNTKDTLGNKLIIQPWIPYRYNEITKQWEHVSVADVAGKTKEIVIDGVTYVAQEAGDLAADSAKKLSLLLQDLPVQWALNIRPALLRTKRKLGKDYDLFKTFVERVIVEDIKPAGAEIKDIFTNDDRLFQSFVQAVEVASGNLITMLKEHKISVADFLTQSFKEYAEHAENSKQFNEIISDPDAEKQYFGTKLMRGIIDLDELQAIEPKARAWMFDQIGPWGWDLDVSANQAKFNPQEGYIEYSEITLESVGGMLSKLPIVGNENCKLRINFSVIGDLKDKKRFEITTASGAHLGLSPDEIKEISKRVEKVGANFGKMSEITTAVLEQKLLLDPDVENERETISGSVAEMASSPEMQDIFLPLMPLMENADEDLDWTDIPGAIADWVIKGGAGPVNENQWSALVTYKEHEMLLLYQNLLVAEAKKGPLDAKKIEKIATNFKENYLKPIKKSGWLGLSDSQLKNIKDHAEGWWLDTDSSDYRAALKGLLALGARNEAYPAKLQNLVDNFERIDFEGQNLSQYANQLKSVALWKFAEMAAPIAMLDEDFEEEHQKYLDYLSNNLVVQLKNFEKTGIIFESVSAADLSQVFREKLKVQSFEEFTGKKIPEQKGGKSLKDTLADLAAAAAERVTETVGSAAEKTADTAVAAAKKAAELASKAKEKIPEIAETAGYLGSEAIKAGTPLVKKAAQKAAEILNEKQTEPTVIGNIEKKGLEGIPGQKIDKQNS